MGFERGAVREMEDGEGMWFGTGLRASATARQARFGTRFLRPRGTRTSNAELRGEEREIVTTQVFRI
jgi:hypothetical protein